VASQVLLEIVVLADDTDFSGVDDEGVDDGS
jgi:hypothetical protein